MLRAYTETRIRSESIKSSAKEAPCRGPERRCSNVPRKKNPYLTAEQEQFVRMEANGLTSPEIIMELWGMKREDDPNEYHNLECKLSRWRKHPQYEAVWREEVRNQDFGDYSEARKTLRKAMRNEKDNWLAMQSAVNILNNSGKRIFGAEENTVTVNIQGMPDLGSPDQGNG
jgi:hypothetical protein